jgi:hypothetical protein
MKHCNGTQLAKCIEHTHIPAGVDHQAGSAIQLSPQEVPCRGLECSAHATIQWNTWLEETKGINMDYIIYYLNSSHICNISWACFAPDSRGREDRGRGASIESTNMSVFGRAKRRVRRVPVFTPIGGTLHSTNSILDTLRVHTHTGLPSSKQKTPQVGAVEKSWFFMQAL